MHCGIIGYLALSASVHVYAAVGGQAAAYQPVYIPQGNQNPVYQYANGQVAAGLAPVQAQIAIAPLPQRAVPQASSLQVLQQYLPVQRQPALTAANIAQPPVVAAPVSAALPDELDIANTNPWAANNNGYQQRQENLAYEANGASRQNNVVVAPPINRRPLFEWPIDSSYKDPPSYSLQDDDSLAATAMESFWPISVSGGDSLGTLSPSQTDNQLQEQQTGALCASSGPIKSLEEPVLNTLFTPAALLAHSERQQATAKKPGSGQQKKLNKPKHPVAPTHVPASSAPALTAQPQPTTPSVPPPQSNITIASTFEMPVAGPALRVGGVMRIADEQHNSDALIIPTQDIKGDIRQEPANGMGMGYHGHKLVRGVNIGGFLVPEFWITPSLISAIPDPKPNDYLQLCKILGSDATLKLMRKHWDTWVTEPEVQRLANAGLTHLRIPIGHWEFVDTDEGYVRGGLPYFKRLVYWAKKYGLRVIPDMHTAPGSQNGFDNSGTTEGINWTRDPRNVAISKRALQNMLRFISSDPVMLEAVDAIDMLNEPFIDSLDFGQLWEYDTGGHTLISTGLHKVPPVVSIVDRGFKEYSWWQPRWPRDWNTKYIDAWLDAHLYHVFDRNIDNWSLENHLRLVCQNGRDLKSNSTFFPIIVGEWSLALPQAALSGRENEARRRFAEAQLDAYDQGGAGWVFWCFKTEVSPEWSFLDALDRSWLPQPLSSREFPQICTH
ncbi:glycoside hydrolase superfamily [Coemansia spiralis]|nr:glycoside hydrolase superfamily [Coemansia spiralis]